VCSGVIRFALPRERRGRWRRQPIGSGAASFQCGACPMTGCRGESASFLQSASSLGEKVFIAFRRINEPDRRAITLCASVHLHGATRQYKSAVRHVFLRTAFEDRIRFGTPGSEAHLAHARHAFLFEKRLGRITALRASAQGIRGHWAASRNLCDRLICQTNAFAGSRALGCVAVARWLCCGPPTQASAVLGGDSRPWIIQPVCNDDVPLKLAGGRPHRDPRSRPPLRLLEWRSPAIGSGECRDRPHGRNASQKGNSNARRNCRSAAWSESSPPTFKRNSPFIRSSSGRHHPASARSHSTIAPSRRASASAN
jgi:hypothetical protein